MQTPTRKRRLRWIVRLLGGLFLLLNLVTFLHAYRFTHFAESGGAGKPHSLSTGEKIAALFTGLSLARPQNKQLPSRPFRSVKIQSNKLLDCWFLSAEKARGTVILFHGYGGEKSSMLDKADVFLQLHYNVLLVDFMGAGGSEGVQTTIGFKEAEEVKDCFAYVQQSGESTIHLFGTSMGAVAVLKAVNEYKLAPASILVECPFGTMYQTVAARFRMAGLPAFPLAGLLMFWGGVQNGFWAFAHNPEEYAKGVRCPTLLLYGEKDDRVSRAEIDAIFRNLQGPKKLVTYPNAAHENYLRKYKEQWTQGVQTFLSN